MPSIRFMSTADLMARDNTVSGEGDPFGAVIVKDGEVVGKGKSTVKADNDVTAHAVMNAIRDAQAKIGSSDLSGCELYSSSFPCTMCLAAAKHARISQIYYGNSREDVDAAGFGDGDTLEFVTRAFNGAGNIGEADDLPAIEQANREFTINTLQSHSKRLAAAVKAAEQARIASDKAEQERQAKFAEIRERNRFKIEPLKIEFDDISKRETAEMGPVVPIDVEAKFEDTTLFDGPPPQFNMPD